ncbi:carbohydrate deacetylase [Lactovum odontotermitis]
MKKIIINADDFGYSSGVNQGILKAFKEGLLSSTTLMANMPKRDEAIRLAKENPRLGVGVHLVLTCGKPVTAGTTLTDASGEFYRLGGYSEARKRMSEDEIFGEWSAQIDYLLDNGIALTHLDSHHHVHAFPENGEIVRALAQKYRLPFRNADGLDERMELPYQNGVRGFADLMNHPAIRSMEKSYEALKDECLKEIEAVLDAVTEDVTEFMVHPAFIDEDLYFGSSFNVQRMREVVLLTAPEVREMFEARGFEIVHY